jgi:hypothetical protein
MITLFAQMRGLLPIFTTHSSGIVNFLGDGDVVSLSRLAGVTSAPASTEAKAKVLAKLGLLPKRPIIGFVEDAVGKAVLEELLDQFGFFDVLDVDIIIVKEGAGGIKTILDLLPPGEPVSSVLGFLDGDMEKDAKKWPCRARLSFLPVSEAPEVEFLNALENDPASFAERFSRPLDKLNRVLGETRGQDHHDRFLAVGKALGFDGPAFTKAALRHFLSVGGDGGAVDFATKLAEKLSVVPPDLT